MKPARRTDPDTSHAAAEDDRSAMELLVYEAIAQFHEFGCTAEELLHTLPNHHWNSITPRIYPLIRKGWVEDTGERRMSRFGRTQRVIRVTDWANVPIKLS